jgi:hypothetical protein
VCIVSSGHGSRGDGSLPRPGGAKLRGEPTQHIFKDTTAPCHPEAAESLACERLPTKDLCTSTLDPDRHYSTRQEAAVKIESRWTARRREQLGVYPVVRRRDVSEKPRPPAKNVSSPMTCFTVCPGTFCKGCHETEHKEREKGRALRVGGR